MAPKRKASVQCEGPGQKKGRQGTEEDSFRSTAEALKAAPAEKRTVRVDAACPLARSPGAQVRGPPARPGACPPGSSTLRLLPSPPGLTQGAHVRHVSKTPRVTQATAHQTWGAPVCSLFIYFIFFKYI